MPYASKAQHRKFRALEAEGKLPKGTASEWAHHTPNMKKLPEKKKKKEKKAQIPAEGLAPDPPDGSGGQLPMEAGGLTLAMLPALLGAGYGVLSNRGSMRSGARGALGGMGMAAGGLGGGALGSSLAGTLGAAADVSPETLGILKMLGMGAGALGGGYLGARAGSGLVRSQQDVDREELYGKMSSSLPPARRELAGMVLKLAQAAEGPRKAYLLEKNSSQLVHLSKSGVRLTKLAACLVEGQPLVKAVQNAYPGLPDVLVVKVAREMVQLAGKVRKRQAEQSLKRAHAMLKKQANPLAIGGAIGAGLGGLESSLTSPGRQGNATLSDFIASGTVGAGAGAAGAGLAGQLKGINAPGSAMMNLASRMGRGSGVAKSLFTPKGIGIAAGTGLYGLLRSLIARSNRQQESEVVNRFAKQVMEGSGLKTLLERAGQNQEGKLIQDIAETAGKGLKP